MRDSRPLDPALLALRDPLARLVEHARTKLDRPLRYRASADDVGCFGEPLSRVLWLGYQWAVTAYGVECRDGSYVIVASRLWENEGVHGWVRHMAAKPWVDLQDFSEALRIARYRHRRVNAGR